MPRERAWSVAQRLQSNGCSEQEILVGLLEHGFPPDEAHVAVGALAQSKVHVDRFGDEEQASEQKHSGYMSLLVAILFLAAGPLIMLLGKGLLLASGALLTVSGLGLLGRGAWVSIRGYAR